LVAFFLFFRLAADHFFKDFELSPERLPERRLATVKSSSSSGQWIYAPSAKTSK